jgi:hypothetical protein
MTTIINLISLDYASANPVLATVIAGKWIERHFKGGYFDGHLELLHTNENDYVMKRAYIVADRWIRRYVYDLYVKYGISEKDLRKEPA